MDLSVVITGASSGIGLAAAEQFAARGDRVFLVGRHPRRLAEAVERVTKAGGTRPACAQADFEDLSQVRDLAARLHDEVKTIDVLANNAGGMIKDYRVTRDGYEAAIQSNHLAPFLLTNLLLNRLKRSAPARVITVASNAHTGGRIDFMDLQGERSYSGGRAYNQSKLANILFTYELARRLRGNAVTANAVHAGVVRTSFGAEDPAWMQRVLVPLLRPVMKSPAQGARTSIHLASAPELGQVSGSYFANRRPTKSSQGSYEPEVATRLWEASADLVGLTATSRV
jgi:retinol dehydrogenase-14